MKPVRGVASPYNWIVALLILFALMVALPIFFTFL